MKDANKFNQLFENNPFVSSSVGDPYHSKQRSNVSSINEHAMKGIAQLIRVKRQDLTLPMAGLIVGEVGAGKTHLIQQVKQFNWNNEKSIAFSYIQPIENTQKPFTSLFRDCYFNLQQKSHRDAPYNQLQTALSTLLKMTIMQLYPEERYIQQKYKTFFNAITKDSTQIYRFDFSERTWSAVQKEAVKRLAMHNPELNETFINAILHYFTNHRRSNLVSHSSIDPSITPTLSHFDSLYSTHSLEEMESASKQFIRSLGCLFSNLNIPWVIVFDRLENITTIDQIKALGALLEFLVDTTLASIPLVFVRGHQWEEEFKPILNQHITTRLETNTFHLKGCSQAQALKLINKRLQQVFPDQPTHDVSPLDEKELRELTQVGLLTPREIIMRTNALLYKKAEQLSDQEQTISEDTNVELPIIDTLQAYYDEKSTYVLHHVDKYLPNDDVLTKSLEMYISSTSDSEHIEFSNLFIYKNHIISIYCEVIASTSPAIPCFFIIDTQSNHGSVRRKLTEGVQLVTAKENNIVFYIREFRSPIPDPPLWPKTNQLLERFTQNGGFYLPLNQEDTAHWYALSLLHYDINEQALRVQRHSHYDECIQQEHLQEFIKKRLVYASYFPIIKLIEEKVSSN